MAAIRAARCTTRVFNSSPRGFALKSSALRGTGLWGTAPFVRRYAVVAGSVLDRISKKQKEAELGGGEKRIETQHQKVARLGLPFLYLTFKNLCPDMWYFEMLECPIIFKDFVMYESIPTAIIPQPPPSSGQTPGHLTFLKIFGQIPDCAGKKHGQMPHWSGSTASNFPFSKEEFFNSSFKNFNDRSWN